MEMVKISCLLTLVALLLFISSCQQAVREPSPLPLSQDRDGPVLDKTSLATPGASLAVPTSDPYQNKRLEMVESTILRRGVGDEDVLRAMQTVPRHLFVLEEYLDQAYADHPLPIGYGQTISQPYIVAWMTELLELEPGDKVLEIGTGSGYQAAVLAELGYVDVYSIEIIPELAERAAQTLEAAGYSGLHLIQGDGYYGWEEHAPFDAIIVTAAPDHLPSPLADQLTEDGRIVIPIGPPGGYQSLWRFVVEQGELVAYNLGGVAFVPFTRSDQAP
jgi:protein-L-isoaspartate(D-aspartate) O-methyltransferase